MIDIMKEEKDHCEIYTFLIAAEEDYVKTTRNMFREICNN